MKTPISKLDLVLVYLYNGCEQAENEYTQLRNNVWFREPDDLDLLDQLTARIKADVYNKVLMDVCALLGSNTCFRDL